MTDLLARVSGVTLPFTPPRPSAGVPGEAPATATTVELQVDQLHPNPRHRRREHCDSDLTALADSMRQHGLLQSLCVRPLADDQYEIISGERRWRAAQLAGMSSLSCRVFDIDENQAFVLALVENLQRQQLKPLEEAQAYQEMLDRGIVRNRKAIAALVGVDKSRITQMLKLLELDPATQRRLKEHPKLLTESHGRLLLQVPDLAERHRLADEVVEFGWSRDRLRAEIGERCRIQAIERWRSGSREFLRSYVGNYAGFSFCVDLTRADLRQAAEVLDLLIHQ